MDITQRELIKWLARLGKLPEASRIALRNNDGRHVWPHGNDLRDQNRSADYLTARVEHIHWNHIARRHPS